MVQFTKQLSGLLIIGTIFFSACHSSDPTPTDHLSVGLHQSARIGSDVIVRVDSIQDSRCPKNVVCIWAGQAQVNLVLATNTDSSAVKLILSPEKPANRLDSTNISLNNNSYKVILHEVNPYPGTGTAGQPQTAVIQVTKL